MKLIEGSETSAYINQTPANYPKGNLLYSVHGESLKLIWGVCMGDTGTFNSIFSNPSEPYCAK